MMDTQLELLNEQWKGILESIRQDYGMSGVSYNTWLLPLKLFRIENDILKITAPSPQHVTYVETKYKLSISVAVAEATGKEYNIKIKCCIQFINII